jgi:L-amino acid N-acyltransferase YncA
MIIRPVAATDAPVLASLLNEIIARGGTTAFQRPFTPQRLAESMLMGRWVICCLVAEESDGGLGGFQSLVRSEELPSDAGDISTFSRIGRTQKGTGSLLFAATQAEARRQGLTAINATIRADNVGGLAFYSKLGFADYSVDRAVPLLDGTEIDRISKRYTLMHDTENPDRRNADALRRR